MKFDVAQKVALSVPLFVWSFCAYKSKIDYESGNYYFVRDFFDHNEMKTFSVEHSTKERISNSNYCSMYWVIEINLLKVKTFEALNR